ncbi:MAG: exodeoxyribonuclease III [Gammaproteobacteria bacterium]|nr:exodeoxyribonuclease III [Gammaproteobacteria bacterium]MDH3769186.1 exodeoxyribonuclease III [Gammaproteobacteria bacterium]
MKIATWNVNSLRVRLQHVCDWLQEHEPDILGLQETKLPDHDFPADAFFDLGYECRFSGQKTYNGVALIFKTDRLSSPTDLVTRFDGFDDAQKRVIAASFDDIRIYNLYVPNGQAVGSEKYAYKQRWITALHEQIATEIKDHKKIVLMGDFNIAPEDRDIHDPKEWKGKIMCSDSERAALASICGLGFTDLFRSFDQPEQVFSWWDYRMGAFRRNRGLRIDLILCTDALLKTSTKCQVDIEPRKLERASDHAPVWAHFNL